MYKESSIMITVIGSFKIKGATMKNTKNIAHILFPFEIWTEHWQKPKKKRPTMAQIQNVFFRMKNQLKKSVSNHIECVAWICMKLMTIILIFQFLYYNIVFNTTNKRISINKPTKLSKCTQTFFCNAVFSLSISLYHYRWQLLS